MGIHYESGITATRPSSNQCPRHSTERSDHRVVEVGTANPYNSARAMYLVPSIAEAWNSLLGGIQKDSAISSEMLRQVSFAVSLANGCRLLDASSSLSEGNRRKPGTNFSQNGEGRQCTHAEGAYCGSIRQMVARVSLLQVTGGDWQKLKTEFGANQGALRKC